MTGKTHASLGLATGTAVAWYTEAQRGELVFTLAAATVAALLPDLDEQSSKINQALFGRLPRSYRSAALTVIGVAGVAGFITYELPLWVLVLSLFLIGVSFAPHRGLTHSLLALGTVVWVTSQVFPLFVLAVGASYLSHLLADAVTSQGVPLFWPWKKRLSLSNVGVRIRTGRTADQMTGVLAGWGSGLMLIWLIFA